MITPLGRLWLEASQDLGIRVTAPFTLGSSAGDVEFEAAVHDFGSSQGMLLMTDWDESKTAAAVAHGFGYSCMDGGSYVRSDMIEVLRDWGWSSLLPAPEWL